MEQYSKRLANQFKIKYNEIMNAKYGARSLAKAYNNLTKKIWTSIWMDSHYTTYYNTMYLLEHIKMLLNSNEAAKYELFSKKEHERFKSRFNTIMNHQDDYTWPDAETLFERIYLEMGIAINKKKNPHIYYDSIMLATYEWDKCTEVLDWYTRLANKSEE